MSLKHALLGFLSFGPATGYDLKSQMEGSVKHFWHADLSQIYRTLDAMREADWVDKTVEHQESRPPRHVYAIEEPGREELRRWLAEPLEDLPTVHNPFLLKVFFGGHLDAPTLIDHLRRHQRLHEGRLERLRELEAEVPAQLHGHGLDAHVPCIRSTIRLGRKISDAYVAWCEETIADLAEADAAPSQTQGER